jgi:transposase
MENYKFPQTEAGRLVLAAQIGQDGFLLMTLLEQAVDKPWLLEIPAIVSLRKIWADQYTDPPGPVSFREVKVMPSSSEQTVSPYDTEARFSTKRGMEWIGYKVHLSETCAEDAPHLITNVETTVATTPDEVMLPKIHRTLAAKELLPDRHIIDGGYTNAENLVAAQRDHQVEIIGPMAIDGSWQTKADQGFDKAHFEVDWQAKTVTCPAGKLSRQWKLAKSPTHPIKVRWAHSDCLPCADRLDCTKAKDQPREISLQLQAQHEAMQAVRSRQHNLEFKEQYAKRAGIEGTLSQGVRRSDLRHARYLGLAKTHFQQIAGASALNLRRVMAWLDGTPWRLPEFPNSRR